MRTMQEYVDKVEEALQLCLQNRQTAADRLLQAMRYSLLSGGKRLRPVLLLAACEMGGGQIEEAMAYACALEMIHTYSCIHDDLPAMDDDTLRRGKPTNHTVFGEAMAILAGDGLLNEAAECMLNDALHRSDMRGVRAAEAILRHAGITGMISGQVMDMQEEGQPVTEGTVRYIHTHKTADLIIAPMEAGLLLAGASEQEIQSGIAYGMHLGLAFQQMDDLLDVVGDVKTLGKQTGMDAEEGKQTWVALRGIERTREDILAETQQAVSALGIFGTRAVFFEQLAFALAHRLR